MDDETRLTRFKVVYNYPVDLEIDTIDEIERFTNHLIALGETPHEDTEVKILYILVIDKKRLASIYIEYVKRRSIHRLKRTLSTCGFDLNLVDITKVEGRVSEYLQKFLFTAYYCDERPYMYYMNESDVEECMDTLA
jgi:hypothetical protein